MDLNWFGRSAPQLANGQVDDEGEIFFHNTVE